MRINAMPARLLARRLGWAGFWFFLLKGLLWLSISAAATLLAS
jgi:hypothetical protein